MVETDLLSYLLEDTTITDLVDNRIWFLKAENENPKKPYIILQNISDVDKTSFQGANYANDTRFQVDIYSKKYSEVKAVKSAVKVAMYDFKYFPHDFTSRDLY